ncbi:unnamed protein product [Moneuplotes crassus]|uniref:Uncharacterized protein n=1 Tax=Euplotes crassus TaxID=5936 RepID=A0AAD2D5U7_EUPCR|nr:unnamed protein product [Moneuplotes crassus]
MIKGSSDSIFDEDIFVCERCAINLYVDKDSIEITDVETILDWLNLSENNLAKIDNFRESHSLDGLWKKMLPDLEAYTIKSIELKDDLETAENTNDWEKIPKIQIQSKMLLSSIFKSKLYKEYIKQINYMKFCDLEAKKKLIKSSYKPLEKSKDINEKSKNYKIVEQSQEAKNFCQKKEDLIFQKDAEIKKRDQLTEEKAKMITKKGSQIKNHQQTNDQKKQTIEQKEQQIYQQDCQMDKLANERFMFTIPSHTLSNQKSNLEQEHSKKDQNIKELQKKLDDLEKKDKIQQNIIEQLQKMTTQQKEEKDRDSTHEHQKDSFESKNTSKLLKDQENNKVGNMEKVLEQQLAICKDTQALIDTLSTSNKKNQKFPLKEFMLMKDTEVCDSKGVTQTNVDLSIIKRTVKEEKERKLKIEPNEENLSEKTQCESKPESTSMSVTSMDSISKSSPNADESQVVSPALAESIKKRVIDILIDIPSKIQERHRRGLDAILKELSSTSQRRVFINAILAKAIEEKGREELYGSVCCGLRIRESNRIQEMKKQHSPESDAHLQQWNFKEELYQEIQLIFIKILKDLPQDVESTIKQSKSTQNSPNNKPDYSPLFSYLKLEGKLYRCSFFHAYFEIETLLVLLGNEMYHCKLETNDTTIRAACLFLQDIGPTLDEEISSNLKDDASERLKSAFLKVHKIYLQLLAIIESYKTRNDITSESKQLITVTLELKKSGWKEESTSAPSPQKTSSPDELKPLSSEFGFDSPVAFHTVLMNVYINWVNDSKCNPYFLATFKNSPYGEQILFFYLKSIYFLKNEEYVHFPDYFHILYKNNIFSVEDVENGFASFFQALPQLSIKLFKLDNHIWDLLYFIFIFCKIGDFEKVLKKTNFEQISKTKNAFGCIDIFFEIFAKFLHKIQLNHDEKTMLHCYTSSSIKQYCSVLKPLIQHPHLFNNLLLQGIPLKIISLINISSA